MNFSQTEHDTQAIKGNNMLKLHNYREGFACNSSSTHSVVLLNNTIKDNRIGIGDCFGGSYFVCASSDARKEYLTAQVGSQLLTTLPASVATTVMSKLFDVSVWNNVDHQSAWHLPRAPQRGFTHTVPEPFSWDFLKEFSNWFLTTSELAVLGGNDNSNRRHPALDQARKVIALSWLYDNCGSAPLVCRKDTSGFWVLFDQVYGTKYRISFDATDPNESNATHADLPELVDLKITSYCDKGCSFCYQNSTPEGTHASTSAVYDALCALADMGVLEVALGGGEPTEHPDLDRIVKDCRLLGMVPNITTANYGWLENIARSDNQEILKKQLGGIAVTVISKEDAAALANLTVHHNFDARVYAQIPMGLMSREVFSSILQELRTSSIDGITYLGYKTCGRAHKNPPYSYDWWYEEIKSSWRGAVGIDTVLAQQFREELEPDHTNTITWEEGRFSFYLDACKGTMHISSFDDAPGVSVQGYVSTKMLKVFQKFSNRA